MAINKLTKFSPQLVIADWKLHPGPIYILYRTAKIN